ncbi:Spy/CpxP family protein refolding chaperone [uncultured Tateyamaria sp.]|uniref:Spy/CpxP family protein refolding chaperone n=1 Tax=uncultured Tateyamaria sp. TaxID=455651 RepID=UPI002628F70D|nr:Spy/CpxP family protein refolding chaperone [uncultured Tateyamaria sp.]
MKKLLALLAACAAASSFALAEGTEQPYRGFEARDITSLSDQDIADLRAGAGWGLALPAELNGFPGPAHVLELADELSLTKGQQDQVSAIYEAMRLEAVAQGEALIVAERALDAGFRAGNLDAPDLRRLIDAAATARADLRYVHLSRHLMTLDILNSEQVAAYAVLRGYADDPCASVPEGHDATMWRRHNGCDNG